MASPMRPISAFGSPLFILFHDEPPLVVLYNPDPGPPPT